jgi:urea carboxylase system permease
VCTVATVIEHDAGRTFDAEDLARFGYPQQLRRSLGAYASFAAGFSFISVLTTVFQLFFIGFSFGGAAFFWTWPIVAVGQLAVAACFAELAARYPISGCIYQWSRRLSTPTVGWFTGWTMLLGQIVTVAASAIALQVVLPTLWSGFQLTGGDRSLTSASGATNAVLLGAILIVATTVVNVLGVRIMATINSVGVTCELIGVVALIVLLLTHSERGPDVVLHQTGAPDDGGYLGLFLISSLMAATVMLGFDSAGELAEETRDPRRTAPRAIMRALLTSACLGGLLVVAAIMAAPSLTDGQLAASGLPYVLTSSLGDTVGKIFLADVAVAICVCTLAIQSAAMRMMFSMSRDGALPFSERLSAVSPRTGTPVLPAIVVGVLAVAILVVNLGQSAIFAALVSVEVVLIYLAYLMVTLPMLVRRLRTGIPDAESGLFSLGRWGLPVNIVAVVFGFLIALNVAWPRTAVYDPAAAHWYLHYFAALFIAGSFLAGALAWRRQRRRSLYGERT